MAQTSRCPGLPLKACNKLFISHELRGYQFERNVTFRAQVGGEVHCAHSATAEQSLQTVLFVKHLTDVMI
jgi:hypothetical protein